MAQAWQYRRTSLSLPDPASARVRALSASSPVAGRGVARRLRVPVRRAADAKQGALPVGVLFLRWSGEAGPVTIYYLGWDPATGGTEDGMRRAAAQLARTARAPAAS
jgi:hypothetical protein